MTERIERCDVPILVVRNDAGQDYRRGPGRGRVRHRKGRLEAALLGSVASNVTQMVTADVLLVREAGSAGL